MEQSLIFAEKDMNRLRVIRRLLKDTKFHTSQAATILGLGVRQVFRPKARVQLLQAAALELRQQTQVLGQQFLERRTEGFGQGFAERFSERFGPGLSEGLSAGFAKLQAEPNSQLRSEDFSQESLNQNSEPLFQGFVAGFCQRLRKGKGQP